MFTDPGATVDAIWTAFEAHVPAATDTRVQYTGVVFEDIRTVPYGGVDIPQTPVNGAASFGGSPLPSNTCKAIKKSTAALGRSGRGRWYFPILDSGELITGDTTSTAILNAKVSALQAFQTALEAALSPGKMGLVSFHHGGAPRNPGVFEQIISWGYDNVDIDTQRRRLLGHNRHR